MSTNHHAIIIGLTGGIASGKSTVSNMFRDLGAIVIDADQIAREIVEPGEPALQEIAGTFGPEVLTDDGRLDRARLGELVFSDDQARAQLNAITHGRIAQRMMERAREAHQQGHRFVLYDAALIVENNLHHLLDSLIVVSANPQSQVERIIARDGLSRDQAQARLDSQMPLAEKLKVADYVIDNNASLESTRRQVEDVFEEISNRVQDAQTAKPIANTSTPGN